MSWWEQNKRTVYTITAVTMGVAAPVATVYCTKKAIDKINEKGCKTKAEIVKTVAPYAIAPTVMTGIGTAASILAYNEGTKALSAASAATSAVTAITASSKMYDDIVKEIAGDKKYKEISDKYAEKIAENPTTQAIDKVKGKPIKVVNAAGETVGKIPPSEIVCETGHGDIIFREKWSNQLIRSDWEYIRKVINDMNERINNGYDVTVNDFYIALGARTTELGDAYYFPNGVKYIADNEHLYVRDDKNQPLGILEFAFGYNPVPVTKQLARL